jgi:DNA-binding response OmpR family regulator
MVINDTQEILELFEQLLTDEGYHVKLYSYQIRDLKVVKEVQPDLIIVDQMFGEEKLGWQLIQKLRMDRDTARLPVVVCSAELKTLKELEGHLKDKNIEVVIKPFDIDDLMGAVKRILGENEPVEYAKNHHKAKEIDKD